MSQLSVNAITNAAGGNTATINGMTPTAQSLQGFRNRIINGDMRIDQRRTGAVFNNVVDNVYTLDRWSCYGNVAARFSIQQSSVAPAGFNSSLLVTSLAATTPGTNDIYILRQYIEGFNTADFGWGTANAQTVTVSFWVRSSLTGTFSGVIKNGVENRGYPFTYTISAANTWEQKSVVIPGDTTGTWGSTNNTGIQVLFSLGAGSGALTPPGAWAAGNIWAASGQVNIVGTNGATFYITGVQLEAGSVATPFERRPYGTELNLCMRYYERRTVGLQANERLATTGLATNANTAQFPIQHLVQKRATPAVNVGNLNTTNTYDGGATGTPSVWGLDNTGLFITNIQIGGLSGTALGRAIHWTWNNASPAPFIEISSEL